MSRFIKEDKKYELTSEYKLTPKQIEGVEFILTKFNCVLGFKVGMGKTLTSLTAVGNIINNTSNTVCFIICPKSANSTFKKELDTKLKVPYSIYTSEDRRTVKGARYVLINYSQLDTIVKYVNGCYSRGYKIIGIFDECHDAVSSEVSTQSKVLRSLRSKFTMRLGLSGTPLTNSLESYWRMSNFIKPGVYGDFTYFQNNFVEYKDRTISYRGKVKKKKEEVGGKNLEELARIAQTFIISRGLDYPLRFFYRTCELTAYEINEYEKAATGLYEEKYIDSGSEKEFAARLHDLQRVVDFSHSNIDKNMIGSKQKLLITVLKEIIDRGEGVLVYTEYEDTYTTLYNLLYKYKDYIGFSKVYTLTGKTNDKKRRMFERDLAPKDIGIVTAACSQSFNLKQVNNVIFFNIPFSVKKILQMIGRITRYDSVYSDMNIWFLEAMLGGGGSIDTYKRLLTQEMMNIIRQVFGPDPAIPNLTNQDKQLMKKYKSYFKRKFLWRK